MNERRVIEVTENSLRGGRLHGPIVMGSLPVLKRLLMTARTLLSAHIDCRSAVARKQQQRE